MDGNSDPTISKLHIGPKCQVADATYSTNCLFGDISISTPESPSHSAGAWHKLDTFNAINDSTSAVAALQDYQALPVSALCALTSNSGKLSSGGEVNYPISMTTTMWPLYKAHRLKGFEIIYKDFLPSVERTASGGIQFMDRLTYEFTWEPSSVYKFQTGTLLTNSQVVPAATLEQTEFRRSWHVMNRNWYPSSNFVHTGTTTTWASFTDLFVGSQTETGGLGRPILDLDRMLEILKVRIKNIPSGLTNVQINLHYNIEIRGIWDHDYWQAINMGQFYSDKVGTGFVARFLTGSGGSAAAAANGQANDNAANNNDKQENQTDSPMDTDKARLIQKLNFKPNQYPQSVSMLSNQ